MTELGVPLLESGLSHAGVGLCVAACAETLLQSVRSFVDMRFHRMPQVDLLLYRMNCLVSLNRAYIHAAAC